MSHEPFDIDPDEARVRSLMRRSDGPVTVRPFRPAAARPSAIPVALAAAGLLVIGIVVGTSLAARRQEVGTPPLATGGLPAPSATHTSAPTATPAATVSPAPGVPVSAGPVPEAGVLYVLGSDDQIYRYNGPTGTLTPVLGRSTFLHGTPDGVNVLERDESATHLRWNGEVVSAGCGGPVVAFSGSGYCAYHEPDGTITVGEAGRHDQTPIAPVDWRVVEVSWSEVGVKVAFTRSVPGPTAEERAHNSLWVRESSDLVFRLGTPRKLYEPASPAAFVSAPRWSPDGRWITVAELPTVSNSIAADGWKLLLIEVASGRVVDLGTTIGGDAWRAWSPSGELAFIRGAGRQTWSNKRLVVRGSDGNEREIALPDDSHVQLAPAWSASGHLAFVIGPSSGDAGGAGYMNGNGPGDRRGLVISPDGSRREVRCPGAPLEGIRPSADGGAYLLLCRAPGEQGYPLSVWLLPPAAQTAVPLVHGIGQRAEDAGGFGYYGQHPHLSTITAWSLAAR